MQRPLDVSICAAWQRLEVRKPSHQFLLGPAVPSFQGQGTSRSFTLRDRIASVGVRRDTKTVQWHLIRQADLCETVTNQRPRSRYAEVSFSHEAM